MSLENILLGMLRRPASGYDLKQVFEQGAKFYWSAELSQIYPTLKRMEKNGLLVSRTEPSPKGPARRVYERTKVGDQQLHDWLRSGPAIGAERFAYIGQLIFMAELNDLDETLTFVQQLREELAAIQHVLSAASEEAAAVPDRDDLEALHDRISLRMGVHSLTAKVAWCDETIEYLKAKLADTQQTANIRRSK